MKISGNYYIIWLDFLGFSNILDKELFAHKIIFYAEDAINIIDEIFSSILKFIEDRQFRFRTGFKNIFHYFIFGDTILFLIKENIVDSNFLDLIFSIISYTYNNGLVNFLENKLLVKYSNLTKQIAAIFASLLPRGSITLGEVEVIVECNKILFFGKGIKQAVYLEKKIEDPLIVVDPNLAKKIVKKDFLFTLNKNNEFIEILNYLEIWKNNMEEKYLSKLLELQKEFLEEILKLAPELFFRKYSNLLLLHNSFILKNKLNKNLLISPYI